MFRIVRASVVWLALFPAFCSGAIGAPMAAHPAFWTVKGSPGTAYILGSVHALPPDVSWKRPEIDGAGKSSGSYVFEVPDGPPEVAEATRFILERGRLPEGTTLHTLLSPVAQRDYDAACALAGMKTTALDDKRPWLAAIVLTVSYMNQRNVTYKNTPDEIYFEGAQRSGKSLLYFDTTREQLEFLARFDETMGVAGFSARLGDFTGQPKREDALFHAWISGYAQAMSRLIDDSFRADPAGARIFADHNRVWTKELEDLLKANRIYFVVAGIAHLVGPTGVPALLRGDGYKVDGP